MRRRMRPQSRIFRVDEQEVDMLGVVDNECFEAVGQEVSGLSVSILTYAYSAVPPSLDSKT